MAGGSCCVHTKENKTIQQQTITTTTTTTNNNIIMITVYRLTKINLVPFFHFEGSLILYNNNYNYNDTIITALLLR